MNKFKLFFFTGLGFGFDWAINMKTGINLEDPTVYVTPVFNALNNVTASSSYNTFPVYELQAQITSQLAYVTLIIKLFPIVPLVAAFMTKDVKGNSIAYVAGVILGFLVTYLLI